jgi:hypothetical protein
VLHLVKLGQTCCIDKNTAACDCRFDGPGGCLAATHNGTITLDEGEHWLLQGQSDRKGAFFLLPVRVGSKLSDLSLLGSWTQNPWNQPSRRLLSTVRNVPDVVNTGLHEFRGICGWIRVFH